MTFLHFDIAELLHMFSVCCNDLNVLNYELLLLFFACSGNLKKTDTCCVYISVFSWCSSMKKTIYVPCLCEDVEPQCITICFKITRTDKKDM